jgi:hypothetical protein
MTVNSRALAGAILGSIPIGLVLFWLIPRGATAVLRARASRQLVSVERKVNFYDPCPGARACSSYPPLVAKVEVEFPQTMRKSETKSVKAWFSIEAESSNSPTRVQRPQQNSPKRQGKTPSTLATSAASTESISPKAKLESNDFKITNPIVSEGKESEPYEYNWLISTNTAGERVLILSFEPKMSLLIEQSELNTINSGSAILVPVSVLTDLSLTTTQDALAKAFAAILTVIGVVGGYSFLKRYFEKP